MDYPNLIGEAGRAHLRGKPFSDPNRSTLLIAMGGIIGALPPPPAEVLDCGVGGGWTSRFLARAGYRVLGIDVSSKMIEMAEEDRLAERLDHLSFRVAEYEALDFQEQFDAVLFFDSLHHAADERAAIAAAARALRPGGILVTHEPGEGHALTETSKRAMERWDVTEKDMPPRVIIALGQVAGLRLKRVLPDPASVERIAFARPATGEDAERAALRSRRLRRFLRLLYSKPLRRTGIVVMQKP